MLRTVAFAFAALAAASASAQPSGVRLPIAQGYYVWEGEQCSRAGSIFRYDGRRAGWYGIDPEGNMVGEIRRIWRLGDRYVLQVRGQDPEGTANPDGYIEVFVTPLRGGRIIARLEDGEHEPLRACPAASLPRWGRRF